MVDMNQVLILIGIVTGALLIVMTTTAYVTRRSFTDEPLFPKEEKEEEEVEPESQEERFSREAIEFNALKGEL